MEKLKAKQIQKLRERIKYYKSWIPLINETFNVNASVKDIMYSSLFQRFILDKTMQRDLYTNYTLINKAYNRRR